MKLVRYSIAGEASVRGGVLEEDVIREYVGDMFEGIELTGSTCPLADATLHAPLSPRHIIGIGANFGIERPTKDILFDEKIGGSVHLALGQAYAQGGPDGNVSVIHWDIVKGLKDGGEIYLDGELVQKNGKWTF